MTSSYILSGSVIFFPVLGRMLDLVSRPRLTRCTKSTTASFSWTAWLLKCFRTVFASWPFVWRRKACFLASVGEWRPILPGLVRTQER